MLSHPNLYRGAQYRPHPHGLVIRQADLELAPGVGYNGCVSVLQVGIGDADAGKGMECGSPARISLEPGVRYGECLVLQPITVSDAESGAGLLCDPAKAGQWDAAAISALTGQPPPTVFATADYSPSARYSSRTAAGAPSRIR